MNETPLKVGDSIKKVGSKIHYVAEGWTPKGKLILRREKEGTTLTTWWTTREALPKGYYVDTQIKFPPLSAASSRTYNELLEFADKAVGIAQLLATALEKVQIEISDPNTNHAEKLRIVSILVANADMEADKRMKNA